MKQAGKTFLMLLAGMLALSLVQPLQAAGFVGRYTSSSKLTRVYRYQSNLLDQNLQPKKAYQPGIIEIPYTVHIDYIFRFNTDTLLGEPIVTAWFAYHPSSLIVHGPAGLAPLPDDPQWLKKIRVSEIRMEVRLYPDGKGRGRKYHALVVDAGVAAKPYPGDDFLRLYDNIELFNEYASFNVPGSPDWDELFTDVSSARQAIVLYKSMTDAGNRQLGYDYKPVNIDIDTSRIETALYKVLRQREKNLVAERNRRLEKERETIEQQQARQEQAEKQRFAEQSFGDQLDQLLDALEEPEQPADAAPDRARLAALQRQIEHNRQMLEQYRKQNLAGIERRFDQRLSELERRQAEYRAGQRIGRSEEDKRFVFRDANGKLLFSVARNRIYSIEEFHEGRVAYCQQDQRCGYLDTRGKVVIPPSHALVEPFRNGIALVSDDLDGEWHSSADDVYYLIDRSGKRVSKYIELPRGWGHSIKLRHEQKDILVRREETRGHCDDHERRYRSERYSLKGELITSSYSNWEEAFELCLEYQ